jgi:cytochrome d ubiquinol oxidase subunit II
MTVVVIILLPVVLAYQTWTYYVFRRRVSRQEFQSAPEPSTPPGAGGPAATPEAATRLPAMDPDRKRGPHR